MATSLELAITAIRSGRKDEGRQLLNLLIQQNPNNEMAWLWMSSVVNTDEQRARCLYHVLAINPDNELARRGLQLLGIVVSDSRPVKVPRDSQPIPVQRPQPEATTPWPVPPTGSTPSPGETQPLAQAVANKTGPEALAPAANQTEPMEERRPFRLDPKTITQELPFTPIREPFPDPARRSPSAFTPRIEGDQPVAGMAPASAQPMQNGELPHPSEPVSTLPPTPGVPSEPVPAMNPGPGMALIPMMQSGVPLSDVPHSASPVSTPPPTGAGAMSDPTLGQSHESPSGGSQAEQAASGTWPEQPSPSQMSVNETRPSQPIWAPHSNPTTGMPQNQQPYPTPGLNSNVTMGMPTQYFQPQNPVQGVPPIHSNATMGMPLPPQSGQMPQPSEPMPVMHPNGMMGIAYAPVQFQPPFPQNQYYHSNSTMAMPTMTEAEARARLLASQPMMPGLPDPYAALRMTANPPDQVVRSSKKSSKKAPKDEDEEQVNLMAVIVFGSLSVTALGGMGMLVLLWFTSF